MVAALQVCGNGLKLGLRVSNSLQNVDAPPSEPPQTPPPSDIGRGHPEYHFSQCLLELQRSFVKTETSNATITAKLDSLSDKFDSLDQKVSDLVTWKTKLITAAITLSAVVMIIWALIQFGSNYITINFKSDSQTNVNSSKQGNKPV